MAGGSSAPWRLPNILQVTCPLLRPCSLQQLLRLKKVLAGIAGTVLSPFTGGCKVTKFFAYNLLIRMLVLC